MNHVLEYDSVELSFGVQRILSAIYMKCETGNVVGLLGRNGSGKSSLLKIVFGAMKADYQFIRIDGKALGSLHIKKRLINYLPQHSLIPNGFSIEEAMDLFDIEPHTVLKNFPEFEKFLLLRPRQLSGGYLRNIETLLILKSKSLFSLLDEPFSGLMPLHIEMMIKLIQQEKLRKGIIITDHLHRHVTSISDRLYVLSNGKTYPVKDKEQLVKYGYLNTHE